MSPCAIHIQSYVATFGSVSAESVDMKRTVVCPEPRQLRRLLSHQQEDCDAKASNELLGIILSKDDTLDTDNFFPDISSFSPPRRVPNPQIRDARFVHNKFTPVSPQSISIAHVRAPNPAVRIEGFHCLDIGNRPNCSIPALA